MLEAVKEISTNLTGAISTITLFSCTISIILYVAGWASGMRWAGVIFVIFVILRALLGGA